MPPGREPCWPFEAFRHLVPSYGWIRDYLAYAIQCTDAPPIYHIIAAIALTANVLAPEHECNVDGEPIPIHDFFLIVGESGNRKSAAIKRALRTVLPCYAETKLTDRIWYPDACTPEGIITALLTDPNRLMVLTEWSELQSQGKAGYWQHAPQFWEMVFDRSPIQRLKINQQVKVDRPSITILGASTPSLVKRHTVLHDWDAGKMARYLICYQSKPEDMEMVNAVEHHELLPDLRWNYSRMMAPSLTGTFVPSKEAKEYKDDWQYSPDWRAFVNRLPEHLKPSGLRAGDHVYRIATLYQASIDYPHNLVIGLDAMIPAIQLVWQCLISTEEAFALLPLHEHQPLTRVRTILAAAGTEGIGRTELLRKSLMHAGELDRVLATLAECEEVVKFKLGDRVIYRRAAFR
jgi:Protein of unknown function (DUF3987)